MQISRKSDYALRAMVYVAAWENDKICSINEISEAEKVPREYLGQNSERIGASGVSCRASRVSTAVTVWRCLAKR